MKIKNAILRYFLRGLVAGIVGFFISLPLAFFAALTTILAGTVAVALFLIVYIPLALIISGWVMTRTVKEWITG